MLARLILDPLPGDLAGVAAPALFGLTIVCTLAWKRSFAESLASIGLALANPFFLAAAFSLSPPSSAILAAACLCIFIGAFALDDLRNDKGVVKFALCAAFGVALIGVVPAIHAPLALFSPLLSPWRRSLDQMAGFMTVSFAPSLAVLLSASYLHWVFSGAAGVESSEFLAARMTDPRVDNLIAMAAAPSILLGVLAPRIAGGSRRAALFAALTLAGLCLLMPAGRSAILSLGALVFAAEVAWISRLSRGALRSLCTAAFVGFGLVFSVSFQTFGRAESVC